MKIAIWSDFVCPFCYIGKRHLEAAIKGRTDIEIEFHSYELDPTAPDKVEGTMEEYFAEHKGMSVDQAQAMFDQVTQMANNVDLDYHYDTIQHGNTLKPHRLFQFAKEQGKGNEFMELAKKAYFIEGKWLNDDDFLVHLAESIGLEEVRVREILTSDAYLDAVRLDQAQAVEIGVQGVPFFVIDEQYGVSGAQPIEVFEQVLAEIDAKS